MKYHDMPPFAPVLMESTRAMGYIPCRYLKLNDKRVAFEDIYRITVTDMSHDTNTEKEQTAFL